jgi:hypothetical protein
MYGMSNSALGTGDTSARLSRPLQWVDRYRWVLIAAIAILYAIGFTDQWRIGPDSAQHLVFARSLSENQGLAQTELIHEALSPGLAHLLAEVFRLSRSTSFAAANLLMLSLGGCSWL